MLRRRGDHRFGLCEGEIAYSEIANKEAFKTVGLLTIGKGITLTGTNKIVLNFFTLIEEICEALRHGGEPIRRLI